MLAWVILRGFHLPVGILADRICSPSLFSSHVFQLHLCPLSFLQVFLVPLINSQWAIYCICVLVSALLSVHCPCLCFLCPVAYSWKSWRLLFVSKPILSCCLHVLDLLALSHFLSQKPDKCRAKFLHFDSKSTENIEETKALVLKWINYD